MLPFNVQIGDLRIFILQIHITMATLEKLVRTVEALKLHQTPSVAVDETMGKKDKIAHCVSVTDIICSQVALVERVYNPILCIINRV